MLGNLTHHQIDHVLQSQYVGRIGCCVDNQPFVVPVTFVYDGTCIYASSKEGMKVDMMRKNPRVCLEVDVIENMANWRSVVVTGRYQELIEEKEREKAIAMLSEKYSPMIASETLRPKRQEEEPQIVEKEKRPIVYQIHITEKTGRYEKSAG